MKEFMWGTFYECLNKCAQELDMFLYEPKTIKTMKFVSYSVNVVQTFVKDYKALVAASEKLEDGS